ncbi:sensor protein TorS [Candidatus Phycosocius bacilliformis]|uniref:histidine kinase n=1 Tax=Candidatus Phycosocius bacilliformis TaxID=1445552 RepID=A0A2P2E7L9_9PROT|nr:PAS-domain containing protein [Candidatus Phycosocius bacilliformis]GBF57062.1 sensor protein TorS [Candidatus Phycosocius bacilliformis]
MDGALPLIIILTYAGLLFAGASWAEGRGGQALKDLLRRPTYALALGVYCTSWTFYGAVGSAVADGWSYVPIYLGPILVFVFGRAFLVRMVEAVKADGASSISEFIGGRFGSSRTVAALVTILALLGAVPYIALQLKSLSTTYALVTGASNLPLILVVTAALLAGWAMVYGTRRYEAAARNDAVLFAVGFESLFKLVTLLAVASFAATLLVEVSPQVLARTQATMAETFSPHAINADFFIITLLSMAAIIALPRQFYFMVIAAQNSRDLERARWPFVAYMLATLAVVIPLAGAGIAILPDTARPDLYVLLLPLSQGANMMAILVFLGGFSAATAMVLVETIALSTMVSNDLVAPALLRREGPNGPANFGKLMLLVRRSAIGAIMLFALLWALAIPDNQRLASIGLVAFAAMAQFVPVLILAVYRGNRDAMAARYSLLAGLLVWFYTLALPQLLGPGFLALLSGTLFDPYHLFWIGSLSPISHGAVWSLGLNLAVYVLVTARRVQASALPGLLRAPGNVATLPPATISDLKALVARFVGPILAQEAFANLKESAPVSQASARKAERLIAGVVGLPSARALIGSRLFGARLSADEVSRLLDETGQSLRFSKDLLAATLEHIDPGVSVVDRDLNIVAWNSRYLSLFNYPDGMVYVGAPVASLIRFNAERGECGPGEIDSHVERRLQHMRRGQPHSFERVRPDGRVIKTVGGPMPSGGYVMCFSDITAEAEALAGLRRARAELEARVEERTLDLREANRALAKADAEKTRFLAAASHDLLQPIHAARLFSSALARQIGQDHQDMLRKLDLSIQSADTLLRALLNISKLDAGGVEPSVQKVALKPLLQNLVDTMLPLATEKGLQVRLFGRDQLVETDPALLGSIVQNFLSNAIRYTREGGIVVAIRQRGDQVRVDVIDTGPGIAPEDHARIFREFERLPEADGGGIGLGLAIVERTARVLGAEVGLQSSVGQGSRFSVSLSACQDASPPVPHPQSAAGQSAGGLVTSALTILVVEDDLANQDAMLAFLNSRALQHICVGDAASALAVTDHFDGALVDYHLGGSQTGLDAIAGLRQRFPTARYALTTAASESEFADRANAMGVMVFRKPVDPAALDHWLAQIEAGLETA